MGRAGRVLAVALAAVGVAAGCRASAEPDPPVSADDRGPSLGPPAVDHGRPPAYAGTWIGPELRLSFAGPWVLIGPREPGPGAQPIELRVSVERESGDAYALRTSVADRYAGDFVRPSDWTLLVEDGALALAMGDEPLARYEASPRAAVLVGPTLLAEIPLPEAPTPERVLACVELASERCVALEGAGPPALGCREAIWAACLAHDDRGEADPTLRAAIVTARLIHTHAAAVRYAAGLVAAAPAELRAAAVELQARAHAEARAALDQLRAAGPLPSGDANLPALEAALGRTPR